MLLANVAAGFTVNLTAILVGRASANRWEFGDGTLVSNRPVSVSHIWSAAGAYTVVFQAYNDSNPGGVSATVTVQVTTQTLYYVAADNGSPVSPYSSWATAATNIQDAVDAAPDLGALVLVSNGVYQTGGRAVDGLMTNRVAVTKRMMIRSVNGPEMTVIRGYQVPGTTNGDGAVRCIYLGNGAVLAGFTLTNGATVFASGGGVWSESPSAVVSNCVLTGNSGGGASGGTLNNCTLIGNSAGSGGGAYNAMLNHCTLTANSAGDGGGAAYSALNNCTLIANSAKYGGGGVYGGTVNNCTLTGNSAGSGGGACFGTLSNCTITGNSGNDGGGAYLGTLNNCIVYLNTATNGANYYTSDDYSFLNYCCTANPMKQLMIGDRRRGGALADGCEF